MALWCPLRASFSQAGGSSHDLRRHAHVLFQERTNPGVMDEAVIRQRIDRWKTQLLDLTYRNRLLNFREGPKTLVLSGCSPPLLEDAIASGRRFKIVAAPSDEQPDSDQIAQALANGRLPVPHDEQG